MCSKLQKRNGYACTIAFSHHLRTTFSSHWQLSRNIQHLWSLQLSAYCLEAPDPSLITDGSQNMSRAKDNEELIDYENENDFVPTVRQQQTTSSPVA